MRKIIFISAFIFWIIHPAFAQDEQAKVDSLSVEKAINYALNHNTSVINSRLDIDIAEKRIWETTATGLPQVSASANYTNNLKLRTTLIPAEFFGGEPGTFQAVQFGTQHNADASITANQMIFNGPYIVGLQAARVYRELSARNYEKTEGNLTQSVKEAYHLLLLTNSSIGNMEKNLENFRKIYEETKIMYEAGFMEETDVDQLNITVLNLENSIRSMERQKTIAEKMLKFQMGMSFSTEIILTDNIEDILNETKIESSLMEEFNVEEHIDYRLLTSQEKMAYLDMKRIKYEYFPTVSAFYSITETAQRREFNLFNFDEQWYESQILGISVNIPIMSSGSKMSRVSQKKIALEKVENSKEQVKEGLLLDYEQAVYDVKNALEKLRTEEKNLELADKIVKRTEVKFREGVSSSLDLTNANNQYINALSNRINARIEVLNAKVRLNKVLNKF